MKKTTLPPLYFLLLGILLCYLSPNLKAQVVDTSFAYTYVEKGISLKSEAKFKEAVDQFHLAANLYQKGAHWERFTEVSLTQVYTLMDLRDYDQTGEKLDSVLFILESKIGKNHSSYIDALEVKGIYLKITAKYDAALAIANEVLQTRQKLLSENDSKTADAYQLIGDCYYRKDEYEIALEYFNQALEIYKLQFGKIHPKIAACYGLIGMSNFFLGNGDKGIDFLDKNLAILNQIPKENIRDFILAYNNLSIVYSSYKRDYEKAVYFLEKASNLVQNKLNKNHVYAALTYHNLGFNYVNAKEPDKAIFNAKKAIQIYTELFGESYDNIARCYSLLANAYLKKNNFEKAIAYRQKVLKVDIPQFDETDIFSYPALNPFNVNNRVVYTLSDKGYDFEELYRYGGEQNIVDLIAALEAFEVSTVAIDYLKINIESNKDKLAFLRLETTGIYEMAIKLAYELYEKTGERKYLNKAFSFMEKGRSSLLTAAINEKESMQFVGIPNSTLQKEKFLKAKADSLSKAIYDEQKKGNFTDKEKLVQLGNEYLTAKEDFQQFKIDLEKDFPDFYQLKYDFSTPKIESVQDYLADDKTMYVSYYFNTNWGRYSSLYAIQVSKSEVNFKQIPLPINFKANTQSFINLINDNELASQKGNDIQVFNNFVQHSQSLYQTLFDSLNIGDKENLIIAPHDLLHYVPFDALLSQGQIDSTKINYTQLPFLVKNHTIRYTYAASLMLKSAEKEQNNSYSLLAFAPSYENHQNQYIATRSGFMSLKHTKKEAENIAQLTNGNAFVDDKAIEHLFKEKAEGKILHLAMHAFTNPEDPMYSGLVFSETADSKEDNTLHAYELYNMDLNSDLAVLSACNTGTGQLSSGEGVMSLARAFRQAGCPNIIMSLWQADDEATSSIMQNFYKHLKNGLGKDKALQQAKLEYLENSPKTFPHYWSTFVLMGDDTPVIFASKSWWVWILAISLLLLIINYFRK